MVWIVGKKCFRDSRKLRRCLKDLGIPYFCMESVYDILAGLAKSGAPVMIFTEASVAVPPESGNRIPVLGIASSRQEETVYGDRAVHVGRLTAERLKDLLKKG